MLGIGYYPVVWLQLPFFVGNGGCSGHSIRRN
jgi:hypothetical protein